MAFNAEDHAAFQHVRRTSSTPPFLPKDLDDGARSLAGRVDRREIALFVDARAMYASSGSSYLLDERYEFLLSEQDRALAAKAGEFAAALGRPEDDAGPWRGLRNLLRDLGARPE